MTSSKILFLFPLLFNIDFLREYINSCDYSYNKNMAKKNITTNDLAKMVNRGFEKTSTVEQLNNLKEWTSGRFDKIDKRFDKIEDILLEEQNRKIEKLESRVEYLENMLNLPTKK